MLQIDQSEQGIHVFLKNKERITLHRSGVVSYIEDGIIHKKVNFIPEKFLNSRVSKFMKRFNYKKVNRGFASLLTTTTKQPKIVYGYTKQMSFFNH